MRVRYLVDCPQHVPTLARWKLEHYRRSGDTLEAQIGRFLPRLARDTAPTTLVAVQEDNALGCASLVAHDMNDRPQWTPWLAGVIVGPAHRRRGIGASLTQTIGDLGTQLGYTALYLFTLDRERFYANLGWRTIERRYYGGRSTVTMSLTLGQPSPNDKPPIESPQA